MSWSSEAEVWQEPEILTFQKWPECATQRPNQGFSALPLSGGVGCPARFPGPEDSWSGSASSWVSRAGSNFQKRRTTQAELSSPSGQAQGPCPRPWGTPLRVQRGQEGSFSSRPGLLGRAQWRLCRDLPGQGTDFPLGFLLGGQGGEVIRFYQGVSRLLHRLLLLEFTTSMVLRLSSPC